MIPILTSSPENPVFSRAVDDALPDMIDFFQPPLQSEVVPHTLDSVRSRVAAMDPSLRVGTPAHDAALILMAASCIGQNVDRLARFTGVRREVVARCARRLVDNGVWQEGHTVSRWLDAPDDMDSFRSDVAVAEGTLCRRSGDDGQMEWAPQGYWRKHYEYVGPRGAEQPQTICYHAHVEIGSQDLPYAVDEADEEEPVEVAPTPRRVPRMVPEAAAEAPVWMGEEVPAPVLESAWPEDPETSTELFPDAVWLG